MSSRERERRSAPAAYAWAACVGDIPALKERLGEKEKPLWIVLQLFDALLRGFGQVVFANNPISGLLIVVALAATAPGTLIFGAVTGFLGLLLSVLSRDSQDHIENGVTVLNPLLVGAISFAVVPRIYGAFDAFSILLVLLGTIFSVYIARALGTGRSPFIVWPFILTEFALLIVLSTPDSGVQIEDVTPSIAEVDNATSDATTVDVSFIGENATNACIDWGMVLHGIVTSASQVYGVNNVAAGAVIYLAVLIFSPTTGCFAFLGALFGSVAALTLGAKVEEIYSGVWGFNCFLTGAALGGNLIIIGCQSGMATIVAIVYTVIMQYALVALMTKISLPVLTLPFVTVTTLFMRLRNNPEDHTFGCPEIVSFPEKQRSDYLARRRASIAQRKRELEEVDVSKDDKGASEVLMP